MTLAGPAMGSPAWIPLLGQFLAGNPRLGLVTLHRYPLKHCSANIPVTIPELLSGASSTGLAESVAHAVAISHARGIPLRIGEIGSIACGGMPGVSDSFASALWSLDALFAMARVNVDGVNMQTAQNPQQALRRQQRARPLAGPGPAGVLRLDDVRGGRAPRFAAAGDLRNGRHGRGRVGHARAGR